MTVSSGIIISIVMPVKNSRLYIGEALKSIENLEVPSGVDSIEVLIADGGSNDGTLDVIKQFPYAQLVSTNDEGIYDGVNKAILSCLGDFILWCNSDDLLPKDCLTHLMQGFKINPEASWVSGQANIEGIDFKVNSICHFGPLSVEGALFGIPVINTRMFRRSCFDYIGLFDKNAGLGADRLFLTKLAASKYFGIGIDSTTYIYRQHSLSKTLAQTGKSLQRIRKAEARVHAILAQDDNPCINYWTTRVVSLEQIKKAFRISDQSIPIYKRVMLPITKPIETIKLLRLWYLWRGKSSGF